MLKAAMVSLDAENVTGNVRNTSFRLKRVCKPRNSTVKSRLEARCAEIQTVFSACVGKVQRDGLSASDDVAAHCLVELVAKREHRRLSVQSDVHLALLRAAIPTTSKSPAAEARNRMHAIEGGRVAPQALYYSFMEDLHGRPATRRPGLDFQSPCRPQSYFY